MVERKLESLEILCIAFIKASEGNEPSSPEEGAKRIKQVKILCTQEKALDKQYEEFKQRKDDWVCDLRRKYLLIIKLNHTHYSTNNNYKKREMPVFTDIHSSSLLSDTLQQVLHPHFPNKVMWAVCLLWISMKMERAKLKTKQEMEGTNNSVIDFFGIICKLPIELTKKNYQDD